MPPQRKQTNKINKTKKTKKAKAKNRQPPKQNEVNEADKYIEQLLKFYSKHTLMIWLLIIFIPLIIITIGCLLWPELFYDQFIWRYFWGTIEADANPEDYGEVT